MATQPDNIDVPHLARIGIIGTIITIAISYLVVGLNHSQENDLRAQRTLEASAPRVAAEQDAVALEQARQAVIDRYAR